MFFKNKKILIFIIIIFLTLNLKSCVKDDNIVEKTNDNKHKDIEIIVPWDKGSIEDKIARKLSILINKEMEKDNNKANVFTKNIPGISGAIGSENFINSSDHIKLLVNNEAFLFNKALGLNDLDLEDIKVLKILASAEDVLVVNQNSKYQTLEALLIQIKANPGKVVMGYSGLGTNSQIYSKIFKENGFNIGVQSFQSEIEVIQGIKDGLCDFGIVSKNLVEQLDDENNLLLEIASINNKDSQLENITNRIENIDNYIPKYNPVFLAINKDQTDEDIKYIYKYLKKVFKNKEWKEFIKEENLESLVDLEDDKVDEYLKNYKADRLKLVVE